MTSALDMPEIMSYIYSKSWKLQFSASSSIIIIEDYYLQTFLHSLDFAMSHGCTAYTLEYATVPAIRRQAAAYAGKHGYICCISDNIGLCLEK